MEQHRKRAFDPHVRPLIPISPNIRRRHTQSFLAKTALPNPKQRTQQKPLAPNDPTDTDPQVIARLWYLVRTKRHILEEENDDNSGATENLVPSPSNNRIKRRKLDSAFDMPRQVSSASASSVSGRSNTTIKSAGSRSSNTANRYMYESREFRTRHLEPRGIEILARAPVASSKAPLRHFRPTDTIPSEVLHSTGCPPECANIWLDMHRLAEEVGIAEQYTFMKGKRLCEDEFASFAKEVYFRGQPRKPNLSEPDRVWRGERMLQLHCPPNEDAHLSVPPVLSPYQEDLPSLAEYSWDIRPDCAYWISLRGFNTDYATAVKGTCFVYEHWILAPYLTVEFKRDAASSLAAVTQCAVAGSIALFNRFQLRQQAMAQNANAYSDFSDISSMHNVRHYAISLEGPEFTIWKLGSKVQWQDGEWKWLGCTMIKLDSGTCVEKNHALRLGSWINEIHRWGLTVHAQEVQKDVKIKLQAADIDTSIID